MELVWKELELGDGEGGLFALCADVVHGIAPPGARFRRDEEDRLRVCWRHAIWNCEYGEPPVIAIALPATVVSLRTKDVVEMLPVYWHDFVREAMVRQIRHAEMFGKAVDGTCVKDRHAQLSGRTLAWATSELAAAFPAESWFATARQPIQIPSTVDELLDRLPPLSSRKAWPRRTWRELLGALIFLWRHVRRWVTALRERYQTRLEALAWRRGRRTATWTPRQSSDLQEDDSRLDSIAIRRRTSI